MKKVDFFYSKTRRYLEILRILSGKLEKNKETKPKSSQKIEKYQKIKIMKAEAPLILIIYDFSKLKFYLS